jgi:hypothetical protein
MIWILALYAVFIATITSAILVRGIVGLRKALLLSAVLVAGPGFCAVWGASRTLADGGGANNSLAFMVLAFGGAGFAFGLLARRLVRSRLS